jgi:alpha-ketoglutarate-dependent taurine dioxygenase
MKPSIGKVNGIERKAISLSKETLIRARPLESGASSAVQFEPAIEALNLIEWAQSNRESVLATLRSSGAILFRGFGLGTAEQLEQFMASLSDELLDYSYRSTPRTLVRGKIYTSTEYPAHQTIPLHNEMSYSRQWPMMIGFLCIEPSADGGETPLADSRNVFNRIDPEIREEFARKQVMYVRNYGDDVDLPWQEVFQTQNRADVEQYCREAGMTFDWKGGNTLRTSQVCQSVAKHPFTGEMVWFNQAHLFHDSSLRPEILESLRSSLGGTQPRNAFFGDGSAIDDSKLELIRKAYESESVLFPWRRGDILLLDNMLYSHGRKPFSGPRTIVVGMAQSFVNQTS